MSRAAMGRAGLVTALLLSSTHCVTPDATHDRPGTGLSHNCLDRNRAANQGTAPDVAAQKDDRDPTAQAADAFNRKTAMRGFEPLSRGAAAAAADQMEAQADIALAPECDGASRRHTVDPGLEQIRHQLVDEMQRIRDERATQRRELQLEGADSRKTTP